MTVRKYGFGDTKLPNAVDSDHWKSMDLVYAKPMEGIIDRPLDEAFVSNIDRYSTTSWEIGNTPISKERMKNYCWQKVENGWIWAISAQAASVSHSLSFHAEIDDIIPSDDFTELAKPKALDIWSNIDNSIKEMVWQCYRKGIATSMSCSGHWPSKKDLEERFEKELLVSQDTIRQQLLLDGRPVLSKDDTGFLGHQNRATCKMNKRQTNHATDLSASRRIEILTKADKENWIETVKNEEHLGYIELYLPKIYYCCGGPDGRHPLQSFADAASILPYADVKLYKDTRKVRRNEAERRYWMLLMKSEGGHCARPQHPYAKPHQLEEEWVGHYWCEIRVQAPRPKRQRATWNALAAMLDVETFWASITFIPDKYTLGTELFDQRKWRGNSNRANANLRGKIKQIFTGGSGAWKSFSRLEDIIANHNEEFGFRNEET